MHFVVDLLNSVFLPTLHNYGQNVHNTLYFGKDFVIEKAEICQHDMVLKVLSVRDLAN